MTLAEITIVLSFVGVASTVFVGMLCDESLKRNTLLPQEANLLRWYMTGMLMLWSGVIFAILYALSCTAV